METPELPPWLDSAFLATALQGGEKSLPQVTVTRFSAALAVGAGNNYMSRLYRVSVDYVIEEEEKCSTLIIKAPFTNGLIDIMTDKVDFYKKEPQIYRHLLPIMNAKVNYEFGPKCYFNSLNNAVIMSDLKDSGYEMCDRFKQLDFSHCKQVFITLGLFHAASVACIRDRPEFIEMVGKEVFFNGSEKFENGMKPWLERSFKIVAGIIKEEEISNFVGDLLLQRVDNIGSSLIEIFKPKPSGLNVLSHGDVWVNNIMFKHTSSGDIVDVKLIDYQIVKYGSPVIDLIYFIWTSANEDVRENNSQELLDVYTMTLNTTLEELGCEERLTEEELRQDIIGAIDWVLLTICNMLPIIVCEAEDAIDVGEVTPGDIQGEPDEKYLKPYSGKSFRALLPKTVTHLLAWVNKYKC